MRIRFECTFERDSEETIKNFNTTIKGGNLKVPSDHHTSYINDRFRQQQYGMKIFCYYLSAADIS
ncbi:hypothetical protein WUBG_13868, partial [Wuchereria bancrofti]